MNILKQPQFFSRCAVLFWSLTKRELKGEWLFMSFLELIIIKSFQNTVHNKISETF